MKLTAQSVKKDFPRAGKSSNTFTAVQPLDFALESGSMVEITGRSGSGKSTLLKGLESLMTAKSNALSGGELRRMAIVRAMLMRPGILLADEPTAGLDSENTRAVLGLLRRAADDGAGVLLVTHEDEAAQFADRVYVMDGGKLCLTPSAE